MDVMMRLPSSSLDILRTKFESSGNGKGLELEEFLGIMLTYLPHESSRPARVKLVMELVELFTQIDVNGDATLEWDEFTSHCIEAGMLATKRLEKPLTVKFEMNEDFVDPLHHHLVNELKYYPELGVILVVEASSALVKVIRASDLKVDRVLKVCSSKDGTVSPVIAVTYAKDLNLLVVCSTDMNLTFWAWDDFRPLGRTKTRSIRKMYYGMNSILYTTDDSGMVLMWQLRIKLFNGKNQCICIPRSTLDDHTSIVNAFAQIPRYNLLATGAMDARIALWDLDNNRKKGELIKHARAVSFLEYSSTNDILLSAGYEHDIFGWDVFNKQLVLQLIGHHSPCVGVQVTFLHAEDELEHAVTCDADGIFKLWKLTRNSSGEQAPQQSFISDPVNGLYRPRLITAAGPRKILAASRELRLYEALSTYVQDFLPSVALFNQVLDRFYVAVGRFMQVWCAVSGEMIEEWYHLSEGDITCMCFDDRQRKVIFGNVHGRVVVINALNGAVMKDAWATKLPAESLGASGSGKGLPSDISDPNGGPMASSSSPSTSSEMKGLVTSKIHDGESDAAPRGSKAKIGHDPAVVSIHYNDPDKCLVAVTGDSIMVFDEDLVEEKADSVNMPLFRFATDVHESLVTSSAFSTCLSLVATGAFDRIIRLWDFQQFRLEGECIGHEGDIVAMEFVGPYPFLVAADSEGTILVWSVRPHPVPYVCVSKGINVSPRMRPNEGQLVKTVQLPGFCNPRRQTEALSPQQRANENAAIEMSSATQGALGEDQSSSSLEHPPSRRKTDFQSPGHAKDDSLGSVPVMVKTIEITHHESEDGEWCVEMFTGDKQGDVKKWNLMFLLQQIDAKRVPEHKLPSALEGYNAKRHLEVSYKYLFLDSEESEPVVDPSVHDKMLPQAGGKHMELERKQRLQEIKERKRKQEKMREDIREKRKNMAANLAASLHAKPVLTVDSLFVAHEEEITSLVLVRKPEAVLTSSSDGNVRVWNRRGQRIANLTMSEAEVSGIQQGSVSTTLYRFELDAKGKMESKKRFAMTMLERMEADPMLPHIKPPIFSRKNSMHMLQRQLSKSLLLSDEQARTLVAKKNGLPRPTLLRAQTLQNEGLVRQTTAPLSPLSAAWEANTSFERPVQGGDDDDLVDKSDLPEEDEIQFPVLCAGKNDKREKACKVLFTLLDPRVTFESLGTVALEESKDADKITGTLGSHDDVASATTENTSKRSQMAEQPSSALEDNGSNFSTLRNSYQSLEMENSKRRLKAAKKGANIPKEVADLAPSELLKSAMKERNVKTKRQRKGKRKHRNGLRECRSLPSFSTGNPGQVDHGSGESRPRKDCNGNEDGAVPESHRQKRRSVVERAQDFKRNHPRRSVLQREGSVFLNRLSNGEVDGRVTGAVRRRLSQKVQSLQDGSLFADEAEEDLRREQIERETKLEKADELLPPIEDAGAPPPKKRISNLLASVEANIPKEHKLSVATLQSRKQQQRAQGRASPGPPVSSKDLKDGCHACDGKEADADAAALQDSADADKEKEKGAVKHNIGIYSKREILNLKIIFDQIDADDSGKVDLEELMDNIDKLSIDFDGLAGMFEAIDEDHSGEISFGEMLALFMPAANSKELKEMEEFVSDASAPRENTKKMAEITEQDRRELRELFRFYDADGGGTLSLAELFEALNKKPYRPRDQFQGDDDDLIFTFEDLERITTTYNFTMDHELVENEFIELMWDFQSMAVDIL